MSPGKAGICEIFDPADVEELKCFGGFEGDYYAWNPTWNYEYDHGERAHDIMFNLHRQRLESDKLDQIHYFIPTLETGHVGPLRVGTAHIQKFFDDLAEGAGAELFAPNAHKYTVYELTKDHISSLADPAARNAFATMGLGVSCFLGRQGGADKILLFVNAPPLMSPTGIHRRAFSIIDSGFFELLRESLNLIKQACLNYHAQVPSCVYTVNEDGILVPKD